MEYRELMFRAFDTVRKQWLDGGYGFHILGEANLHGILRHHKYSGEHEVIWIADSTGFFVGQASWPLTKLCVPNIEVVGNVFENAPSS